MPFKGPLEKAVTRASGALGIVFVAEDGETIDQYTSGGLCDIRLAGAHNGIVLQIVQRSLENISANGDMLREISITSDKNIYTLLPVLDGNFLVLVQDRTGIRSQGLRVLREAVEEIAALI
ncbi:MAG: hypothetical protein GXP52_00025 [Deltaproteobacteria bacterium]|nr:hypothetical protein [Deltaproteobacteria bacterium]